jgi:hypothetical protein
MLQSGRNRKERDSVSACPFLTLSNCRTNKSDHFVTPIYSYSSTHGLRAGIKQHLQQGIPSTVRDSDLVTCGVGKRDEGGIEGNRTVHYVVQQQFGAY